jgi:hypothetical protein
MVNFGSFSINQLLATSRTTSNQVAQENNARLADNGLIRDGMDQYETLAAISNENVSATFQFLDTLAANHPDIPKYSNNTYTPPAAYGDAMRNARAASADIAAKLAADPNWKGTPSAAALREQAQIDATN